MKITIYLPKLGESIHQGTIFYIYKKVGDLVEKDETLFEVVTDKVTTDIPSPYKGKLTSLLVTQDQEVAVGDPLAEMEIEEN